MTQDEIIDMALQAGWLDWEVVSLKKELKAFAKLVATKAVDEYLDAEREAELRARGEA